MGHRIFSFNDPGDLSRMTAWVCVDDVPAHGEMHVHVSQTYELRHMKKLDPEDYTEHLKIGDQIVLTVQGFLDLAEKVRAAAGELSAEKGAVH